MPCYQLTLLARPDTTAEKLALLFRAIARVVYREHGQFRYLENFGVRPLAFPVRKGGQKFEEVRWVHAYFDISPAALSAVAAAIGTEKGVLQYKYLRSTDTLSTFKPGGRKERLKRFSTAMRYNAELFDPETLTLHAPGSWSPPEAGVASNPSPAAAQQLR
jgi:ribosomal protein S6